MPRNMDSKPVKRLGNKRFWYSIMPLLFMIGIIVIINLLSPDPVESEPNRTVRTAVAVQVSSPQAAGTRQPILQATILPSPTPTVTPLSPISTNAAILLFGPPPGSILPALSRVAFYWSYSETIQPGQEFVLTVRQNGDIVATTAVSQPNFGDSYQAALDFGEIAAPGTAVWQVHLQWRNEAEPLLTSETRNFTLLPED